MGRKSKSSTTGTCLDEKEGRVHAPLSKHKKNAFKGFLEKIAKLFFLIPIAGIMRCLKKFGIHSKFLVLRSFQVRSAYETYLGKMDNKVAVLWTLWRAKTHDKGETGKKHEQSREVRL